MFVPAVAAAAVAYGGEVPRVAKGLMPARASRGVGGATTSSPGVSSASSSSLKRKEMHEATAEEDSSRGEGSKQRKRRISARPCSSSLLAPRLSTHPMSAMSWVMRSCAFRALSAMPGDGSCTADVKKDEHHEEDEGTRKETFVPVNV